ncbi:FAD-dependent oxidoreductase [Candidatus Thiosymbion oneisti]|uniref:FAD-dependent oxidoreductase n=1 Tax=Candidatus Thiosymbion oneisti TaxID=589554 RepID=UPI000AD85923|nr:FAD-dependent oxidoreductase [Candidatus Thiosymbion oneisti]
MHQDFEHIVIGAGISGLGMAHRAVKRGVSTLVLEGEDRVGGCMNSRTFPGCGDFWIEAGSHTCFNSYGHLLDTLRDLELLERLTAKRKLSYQLWHDNERRSIVSSLHPWDLIRSLPRLFTGTKAGKGVAEFFGAGLGRRNYRDLFGPAFRAVVCQEVDDFPADLLFRRKPRRKEIMRSFTFPGGLSDVPQAIACREALEVRTGQRASRVVREGDGYQVLTAAGDLFKSRYLSLAVPPDAAAVLLPEELEELRDLVGGIGIAAIETLVVCVPAAALKHLPALAGLIAVDDAFYSMVSRDYLPDRRYRGFAFHFRPRVLDADAQMDCICRVLGVAPERIAGLCRVSNRLPALRAGHPDLVRKVDALLADGRLAVTGNWFFGVSIEDCLTRSHQECERLFPG